MGTFHKFIYIITFSAQLINPAITGNFRLYLFAVLLSWNCFQITMLIIVISLQVQQDKFIVYKQQGNDIQSIFNQYFISPQMVEKTKKTVQARAKISHKLARYVRATPVHLQAGSSADRPSTTHLTLGGAPRRKYRNSQNTWYPADDEKVQFKRKRNTPRASTGRKSITPGTVVILLSGVHRGRRVVALKALDASNILVTGPYAINGVPLKRVNAAHVIATSTKVPLDGVTANIDKTYFKKQETFTKNQLKNASQARTKRVEAAKAATAQWKTQAKQTQKTVDAKLIENIKKVADLSGYLGTRFTLSSGVRPHELKF